MFYRKAEWEVRRATWFAWPSDEELWEEHLPGAQKELADVIAALNTTPIVLLFNHERDHARALVKFPVLGACKPKIMPYGDIWLRDTLPISICNTGGHACSYLPRFNGWGQKYSFEHDMDLGARVAHDLGGECFSSSLVFEGGAIEVNGAGTLLTTKNCLVNANRNPHARAYDFEAEFHRYLGVRKTIWLEGALVHDHTDGHIDTLARFISSKHIVIMSTNDTSDPNYQTLTAIKEQLMQATDANGDHFQVFELPSPGLVHDRGRIQPASYVNFIITDDRIIMPTYGSPEDARARDALQRVTKKQVLALSAKAILSGGGAFHCISQEVF